MIERKAEILEMRAFHTSVSNFLKIRLTKLSLNLNRRLDNCSITFNIQRTKPLNGVNMEHKEDVYNSEAKRSSRIEFGVFLKKCRKEKGLSIRKLASNCGLSASYLSYLERGIHGPPSIDVTEKLANELDVSKDTMLAKAGHIDIELSKIIMELTDDIKSAIRSSNSEPSKKDVFGRLGLTLFILALTDSDLQELAEENSEEIYEKLKILFGTCNFKLKTESDVFQKLSEVMQFWKTDLEGR